MAYCKKPSAVYRNRMQRYPDSKWLIWSNKWGAWYRDKSQGYTTDIFQAGIFTRDEAATHMSDGPKKHRVTEPFPLSSVATDMLREAVRLDAQASIVRGYMNCLLERERDDGR